MKRLITSNECILIDSDQEDQSPMKKRKVITYLEYQSDLFKHQYQQFLEKREKELQEQEFLSLEEKINSLRQVLNMHNSIVESNKDKKSTESNESDESTETIEEKESTSIESDDDEIIISVKKHVLEKLDEDEYEILGKQKKQNEYTPFLLMSQSYGPDGYIGLLRTKMINEFHPLFETVSNAIKNKKFPDIETEVRLWGLLRGDCNDCNSRLDKCICEPYSLYYNSINPIHKDYFIKREQNLCQFLDINPNDFNPLNFINFTIGEESIGLDEEYHENDDVKNILLEKGIFFLEEYDYTNDESS